MRDRYELKTEIDSAQADLERNLHELRAVIVDKVDVKAKVGRKVEQTKERALDQIVRGREIALDLYAQARKLVRDRPVVVFGLLGGLVVVSGLVLKIRGELGGRADRESAAIRSGLGRTWRTLLR